MGERDAHGGWVPEFRRWDVGQTRHYDHGLLLFSTVTVALSIFAMGMLWIHMGWADGAGAVALGAVSMLLLRRPGRTCADDPVVLQLERGVPW